MFKIQVLSCLLIILKHRKMMFKLSLIGLLFMLMDSSSRILANSPGSQIVSSATSQTGLSSKASLSTKASLTTEVTHSLTTIQRPSEPTRSPSESSQGPKMSTNKPSEPDQESVEISTITTVTTARGNGSVLNPMDNIHFLLYVTLVLFFVH